MVTSKTENNEKVQSTDIHDMAGFETAVIPN